MPAFELKRGEPVGLGGVNGGKKEEGGASFVGPDHGDGEKERVHHRSGGKRCTLKDAF